LDKSVEGDLGAEKQLTERIDVVGAIEEVVRAVGKKTPPTTASARHAFPAKPFSCLGSREQTRAAAILQAGEALPSEAISL
jgi:hypothetical protein